MAESVTVRELAVRIVRLDARSARVTSTARTIAPYPTPLEPKGLGLSRPAATIAKDEPEEHTVPLEWLAWLARRPPKLPVEPSLAVWRAIVPGLPAPGTFDRIVLDGAHAIELASMLPPREAHVLCARLDPIERVHVGMPLELVVQGTDPRRVLSDDFIEEGLRIGALRIRDAQSELPAAILHLGPGGDHGAAHATACRLLCVETDAHDPWLALRELEHAPAHAMVVVSGDSGRFFPTLYHKILHDWPVDRAVGRALSELGGARVAVGFRPGGETDLLLSRLIAERCGLLQLPPITIDEEEAINPAGPGRREASGARRAELEGRIAALREALTGGIPESALEALPVLDEASLRAQLEEAEESLAGLGRAVDRSASAAASRAPRLIERFGPLAAPPVAALAHDLANASRDQFQAEGHSLLHFARLAERGEETRPLGDALLAPERSFGAARWTHATLEKGSEPLETALPVAQPVTLAIAISPERKEGAVEFPFAAVEHLLRDVPRIPLDIELFAEADDWEIPIRKTPLELPAVGASQPAKLEITPRRAGRLPLRVCLYHRNLLVQSLALRAHAGVLPEGEAPYSIELDYAATTDFQLLDERPSPGLSLFENDAEGTHWIGTRTDGDDPKGALFPLPHDLLRDHLSAARKTLSEVHEACSERYEYADPKNDHRDYREAKLVELAKAGFRLAQALFATNPMARKAKPSWSADAVPHGGLVSVSRLRGTAPSIPWQMIYDRPLYVTSPQLTLCAHAREEMGKGALRQCGATCPKAGTDEEELTVCPLGFWGLRYRIEQPLDMLETKGAVPDLSQVIADQTEVDGARGLRIAYNAGLVTAPGHVAALSGVAQGEGLLVPPAIATGSDIRKALRRGDGSVFYFFCHGEHDAAHARFSLVLANGDPPDELDAASLAQRAAAERSFLVVLNVCNSVEATSDRIHELMMALRSLGAIGAVSTETRVRERFGTDFGERLIAKLAKGDSLGPAFLDLRWELLTEALDASAFVYTLNALDGLRVSRAGSGR